MKKLFILFALICFSFIVNANTDISFNSLGHENYGIEVCTHNNTCTYFASEEQVHLSALDDVIIKIVDKQEDRFSLAFLLKLDYNGQITMLIYLGFAIMLIGSVWFIISYWILK